ncbi:hypothetical protein, partial [Aeromonas rivipollensis]|uniref:hypothetical protein n=1 Tax=Aeromonas rivipollensis TaxID=948519 RepID=UPI001969F446
HITGTAPIERADQLTGDQVILHIEDEITVFFLKGHTTSESMTRGPRDDIDSFKLHQYPSDGLCHRTGSC